MDSLLALLGKGSLSLAYYRSAEMGRRLQDLGPVDAVRAFSSTKGPDAVYAAGGQYLFVFSPEARAFEKWDLGTLGKVQTKMSHVPGVLTVMEMGLANPWQAIVSYADSTDRLAHRHYGILDLRTFKVKAL